MASSLSASVVEPCACCSKQARTACLGCKESPVSAEAYSFTTTSQTKTVYYCSKQCQASAWPTHKRNCKASSTRRSLYRAADTIHKAFFIFREKVYDNNIVKIEEKDGLVEGDKFFLCLTEERYETDDVLLPFPAQLVTKEKDRQAILTFSACTDASAWMHGFIKVMLEHFHAHLEEVVFRSHHHRRSTKLVYLNGVPDYDSRSPPHEVMKITLPNGEAYALDLASAQHGYYDSIVPWTPFVNWRVDHIQNTRPFGSQRRKMEKELKSAGLGPDDDYSKPIDITEIRTVIYLFDRRFANILDATVLCYLDHRGWKDFSQMLKMPQKDFQKKQQSLLLLLETVLQRLKAELISMGELGRKFGKPNNPELTGVCIKKSGILSAQETDRFVAEDERLGKMVEDMKIGQPTEHFLEPEYSVEYSAWEKLVFGSDFHGNVTIL